MKIGAGRDNLRVMAQTIHARPAEAGASSQALDVGATYDAHAEFVWRALHRMGVASEDLADLLQEVFVVVHRRRADYDPERAIRGWLWGIALGLARNHRRKTARVERLDRRVETTVIDDPERALRRRRQQERGQRLLAELDPEKRAVFVMFEVEGLPGREIARVLDVPLGTVHSRLHSARRALAAALEEDER